MAWYFTTGQSNSKKLQYKRDCRSPITKIPAHSGSAFASQNAYVNERLILLHWFYQIWFCTRYHCILWISLVRTRIPQRHDKWVCEKESGFLKILFKQRPNNLNKSQKEIYMFKNNRANVILNKLFHLN